MSLALFEKLSRPACLGILFLVFLAGCATPQRQPQVREFVFGRDTFAFKNQLDWEYFRDANGNWSSRKREPAPDYSLHCFPMVRACREFFLNASFKPEEPFLRPDQYRKQVQKVIARDSRTSLPMQGRIAIPGYPDLFSFSAANEALLKDECGSAASSYFQRGHWRMVFPFRKQERQRIAEDLLMAVEANWPPIVHVLTFPKLTINHAVLVYGAEQTPTGLRFYIYDPNDPKAPGILNYNRKTRRFNLPQTSYFPGGKVEAYEVFKNWKY